MSNPHLWEIILRIEWCLQTWSKIATSLIILSNQIKTQCYLGQCLKEVHQFTLPSLTPAANVSHLPPSPNHTSRTFSLLYWGPSTFHIQPWVGLSHPWSPSSFISDPYLPHLNIETHRLSPSKVSRIAMVFCLQLCFSQYPWAQFLQGALPIWWLWSGSGVDHSAGKSISWCSQEMAEPQPASPDDFWWWENTATRETNTNLWLYII